jgi:hypothetical protein
MNLQAKRALVTVVIQTVGRQSLVRAVKSILNQSILKNGRGARVDVWIGVDNDRFGTLQDVRAEIDAMSAGVPDFSVFWLDIGYTTSLRGPGVHNNLFGGSLRTVLTFLAKSRWVAYLDDDDWWHTQHLELLVNAIQGKKWAWSLCWFTDGTTEKTLGVDVLESAGPGQGVYAKSFGGFVRPSALMLDKLACMPLLHLWSISPLKTGGGQDRAMFHGLLKMPEVGATHKPTVYYAMDPNDTNHEIRLKLLKKHNPELQDVTMHRSDSVRDELAQEAERLGLVDNQFFVLKRPKS